MKKKIIILIILMGLLLFGFIQYKNSKKDKNILTLYGNVDIRDVNLSFRVAGLIKKMTPEEGDSIKKDQVVAYIDKSQYEDQQNETNAVMLSQKAQLDKLLAGTRDEELQRAKSTVKEREAALVDATLIYNKNKKGFDAGVVSLQNYQSATQQKDENAARLKTAQETLREALNGPRKEDIAAARANLNASKAKLENIKKTVSYTALITPSDGAILTRIKEPGAYVNAGEPVYSLAIKSPKWVQAYVGEENLGKIKPGMTALISNDTYPDKTYTGTVGFVSPTAEFTPKSVETPELRTSLVYRLRLTVKDEKDELRQGMPVTVKFNIGSKNETTNNKNK